MLSRPESRLASTAVLLLAALLVPACQPEPPGETVARVNGRPIAARALADVLPWSADSADDREETKRYFLDELINKELFVEEAEVRGLDEEITYQLEMEKKGLVTQELFTSVAGATTGISELELQSAHNLLKYESWLKVIEVPDKPAANRVLAGLQAGTPFETLAVRHSTGPEAISGGDQGYKLEFAVQEPFRSAVLALEPGGHSPPVLRGTDYLIIMLVDRRLAQPQPPPLGEMRQELEWRIRQQRRKEHVQRYVEDLRSRLVYNPDGLDILCKPVDSIAQEETETWVAIRDGEKYVKVGRLLHVARRFPASLDTSIRTYAIRRAIEEDLLYEDGLERGVDRLPRVRDGLEAKRRHLLYEALFRTEVSGRVTVTDQDVREHYEAHRENYLGSGLEAVAPTIRHQLVAERQSARAAEYRQELRARARIDINEAVLASVEKERPDSPE